MYVINYIKSKHTFTNPFNEIIKKNTLDYSEIDGDKPIEESTWQFQIFYLCTAFAGFTLMEYMIPLAKKLYPNEFNWNEVEQLI